MSNAPATPAGPVPVATPGAALRAGLGLAIIAAVVIAYWQSANAPFFFDDHPGIVRNESIRRLWPLPEPLSPPTTAAGAAGRPIVNLTLALNYAWGGLAPAGYHWFNVALHAAVALLLFAVLGRTLRQAAVCHQPELCAAAAALVWAVHPLTTESVVCVIQRNEILVALFLLATLYAFMRSVNSRAGMLWQLASVACCALGMASKETMVGAPLIVLLHDRAFSARSLRTAWSARWRYYCGLFATWLLLGLLVAHNRERAGTVGFGLGTSPWDYLVTQFHALAVYARLSFWPHPLVADYGFALAPLRAVWPEAILVVAAAGVTVFGLRRNRRWAFAAATFFILLAPSSSLLPLTTQTIAEHRMYLPLAAVIGLCACGSTMLLRRRAWLGCAVAAPLIVLTAERVKTYRLEKTIWADTAAKRPGNARAWSGLAHALVEEGRWAEAGQRYATAVQLRPDYADTQNDYANVLLHLGRGSEALAHYREAHRLKPDDNDIQLNYADALVSTGDVAGGIENFQAVLARDPRNFRALNSLGNAWLGLNRYNESLASFTAALAADPGSATAHNNTAVVLMNLGRYAEAVAHYESALRQLGGSALVHHNLALALEGAGRVADAMEQEREALKLDPTMQRAREHLDRLAAGAPNR